MTTIAWDGATLASDSQSTNSDAVSSLSEQKIFLPGSSEWLINGERIVAIATAGDCGIEEQLFTILSDNLTYKTEFTTEPDFAAIAITDTGRAWLISKEEGKVHASIWLRKESVAIGSGQMIARTAMRLGKTAIEAVQLAIEMDVYSGGGVQAFTANTEMQKPIKDE